MIFIINTTNEAAGLKVRQLENGLTDLVIHVADNIEATLFRTSDEAVKTAFSRRFPSGKTNLPNKVNRHYFLANGAQIVMSFPDDITTSPIELITTEFRDQVKKYPKNLILVISKFNDNIEVSLDDERNLDREFTVVAGDYAITYVVPKWANWGGLKYRAVINIGNEVYELTAVTPEGAKHPQNTLLLLSGNQVEEYKQYRKELEQQFEERRKQIEEAKTQRGDAVKQGYTQKKSYVNRSSHQLTSPIGEAAQYAKKREQRQPRPNGKKARKARMGQK